MASSKAYLDFIRLVIILLTIEWEGNNEIQQIFF